MRFYAAFACPEHHVTMGEMEPYYFSFNEPSSACPTCLGLGIYLHVHPDLLVPDKSRSIRDGAFIPEAFKYDKNTWADPTAVQRGRSTTASAWRRPSRELPPEAVDIVLYGTKGERFPIVLPEGATKGQEHVGQALPLRRASSTRSSAATVTTGGRRSPTPGWRSISRR